MSDELRDVDHEAIRDDLAAYALGALPPDEVVALEAHLDECGACRERLHWLTPAVDQLPAAVPQESPPERLRASLMEVVRAEAAPPAAALPERRRSEPWWRSLANFTLRPATGLALVAVLVAGLAAGYLVGGSDSSDPVTTYAQATGLGAEADNVSAVLERSGDSATLHVQQMPKLARGEVYEVWVQRAGVMEPKSLFVLSRDGTAEAAVPGPLDGGEAVYVTAEKAGGAQTPSLPALLEAPL